MCSSDLRRTFRRCLTQTIPFCFCLFHLISVLFYLCFSVNSFRLDHPVFQLPRSLTVNVTILYEPFRLFLLHCRIVPRIQIYLKIPSLSATGSICQFQSGRTYSADILASGKHSAKPGKVFICQFSFCSTKTDNRI